ncbi:MAG TPA: hypothetical protein VFK05_17595 [Polyangiaceae bacterium]|nr:hypothetical protein [Polyangiaceae bacterium]
MDRPPPSLFLLVPGPWRALPELSAALAARGVEATIDDSIELKAGEIRVTLIADDQLARAFSWGRGGPLDAALLSRIEKCKHAALVEIARQLPESALEVARIGRALRDAGGLAVRIEASGGACAWESWLECLESGRASQIYETAVVIVDGEDGIVFTCGMHLFDLPDAQITLDDTDEAIEWLDALCTYQLDEDPVLVSGHTFRPTADTEPRVLERWPDSEHDAEDGRHNPFGLWHLKTRDSARVKDSTPVLTFIPSLAAILTHAESSKGRPLTRSEVEQIVDEGTVIAMEPRDARALERSRGYADLEPELAWEQWQLTHPVPAS